MNKSERLYHDLIGINSVYGNEKEIASFIANKIESFGLKANYLYFDDNTDRPSIYTKIKGKSPGRTIMLIGHMDTVDVCPGWNTDPFEPIVIGDKTYGLGAMDMKGGLTAIIEALEYFVKNKNSFTGEIIGAFVVDEECASRGTYKLMEANIKADMAIMAEGRYDMAIGFRGRYSLDISVSGVAKHSQFYPEEGENAILKANKLAVAIESIEAKHHNKLGKGSYLVKHIEGGYKDTLTVPEKCEMIVERFFVLGENFESIKKEILEEAKALGMAKDVNVLLRPKETPYMEPFCIDEDHILVKTMQQEFQNVTGEPLKISYDLSVCDSNILANVGGIPTVTFGPSGEGLHGANECGYYAQIEVCKNVYIKAIESILQNK